MIIDDAMKMDKVLMDLSAYHVSRGLVFIPKDGDDFRQFQTKIAEQFNIFKKLIQCGEFTLVELEEEIVNQNAPMYIANRHVSNQEKTMNVREIFNNAVAEAENREYKYANQMLKYLNSFKDLQDKSIKNKGDDE